MEAPFPEFLVLLHVEAEQLGGAMPAEQFGRFTAAVPPPLSIGSVLLSGGRWVKGFLVEAQAVNGARDISAFGGWRKFVARGQDG